MKKIILITVAVLLFTNCEKKEGLPELSAENIPSNDQIASSFVKVLNEETNQQNIFSQLQNSDLPISLTDMFSRLIPSEKQMRFLFSASISKKADNREVYEFWLHHKTDTFNPEEVLVAYAPDNAEQLKSITAFDLQGNKIELDAKTPPEVPVIVIEKNGFYALQLRVEDMNDKLQNAGLQSKTAVTLKNFKSHQKTNLETTKLDKISLKDDQEPWIKGGAEIYAITSGIRDTNNAPELKIIPMYYLDDEDETYYPNQIMLFWDEYQYQAANIQLFEQDSNYNYQELISIIIDGVTQITGTLSGQPWVNALGNIAGAIIDVLPAQWYTDDDDYIDSFYTIEKNKSYSNHYGASKNAKVDLSPFTVLGN